MTWCGDSIGVDYGDGPITAYDLTVKGDGRAGTFTTGVVQGLAFETWVHTMGAGDVADAVVAWVVTVTGGAGTLRLADGLDASYSDPTATTDPLGDHAVTAGQTLTVPASAVTAADVYADTEQAVLTVEGVSGSVVVDQVKVTVWPSTGPRGGWGEDVHPAYAASPSFVPGFTIYEKFGSAEAPGELPDSAGDAQSDVRSQFAADDQPTYPHGAAILSPVAESVSAFLSAGGPPLYEDYFASASGRLRVAFTIGAPTARRDPFGGDGVTNPNPHATRQDADYRKLDVGDPWVEWVNDTVQAHYSTISGPLGGAVLVGLEPLTKSPVIFSGTMTDGPAPITWPGSGVNVVSDGGYPLGLTGPGYVVTLQHSMIFDDLELPGYEARDELIDIKLGEYDGETFLPLEVIEHYPAYRVWDPEGAVARPLPRRWRQRGGDGLGMDPSPIWRSRSTQSAGRWRGVV